MKPVPHSRFLAVLLCLMIALVSVADVLAQQSPATPPTEPPTAPKPKERSRSSVTIIKDGEVVFSKSVDGKTSWRSLDEAINSELADSVRKRVRSAINNAGKRVNISATGNTMTIIVDDENDNDGKNVVMSFTTDGTEHWGRAFAETFRHNFQRGMGDFNINMHGLRDMANKFHVMVAPHARKWRYHFGDEEFTSDKAERLADEATDLSREADALRKEAEAMRLEAEAMKKRAEAMKLEAEARKKSNNASNKESNPTTVPSKKKK